MAGTTWDGGRTITVIIPVAIAGSKSISRWTCADGSCPALNVSRCPPPAARFQLCVAGGAPLEGSGVPPRFGGPAGTYFDDAASCHAARAAPWLNGSPNGPLAVSATARDSMDRPADGADCGFAGSYGGRT